MAPPAATRPAGVDAGPARGSGSTRGLGDGADRAAVEPASGVCLGRLADLPDGALVPVRALGLHLLLARDGARIAAVERACPHEGADLARGRCAGGRLHCPHHRAAFDLATGAVSPGWSFRALRVAPVRVEAGRLWAEPDALRALAGPR